MKKDDLIQKSDNTKVDVGTAELPRWKAPFVPNYYEGEREYKKGNYTNPHAKTYAERISGRIEPTNIKFDVLSGLGLSKLFTKTLKVVDDAVGVLGEKILPSKVFHYKWKSNIFKNVELNLPSYAKPNAPVEQAKQYFKKRVENGGWDKYKDIPYDKEFIERQFHPIDYRDTEKLELLGKKLNTKFGVQKPQFSLGSRQKLNRPETRFTVMDKNKVAKLFNKNNRQAAIAHEAGYAVTNNQIKKEIEGFGNLKYSGRSNYFTKNNWTELSQRGSQIKNYFGLTKSNQEVTPEMLEYAYQNYIKDTGINNNMGEFFFSITDFQKAAKWITENSLKNGGKIE